MKSISRIAGALLPDTQLVGPAGVDLSEGYTFTATMALYLGPGRYGEALFDEKTSGITGTTTGATISWAEGEVDTLEAGRLYVLEVVAERTADDKLRKLQGLIFIRAALVAAD